LGEIFQSAWVGFGIVAAFSVLIFLIILFIGKPFKKNSPTVLYVSNGEDDKNEKTDKNEYL